MICAKCKQEATKTFMMGKLEIGIIKGYPKYLCERCYKNCYKYFMETYSKMPFQKDGKKTKWLVCFENWLYGRESFIFR